MVRTSKKPYGLFSGSVNQLRLLLWARTVGPLVAAPVSLSSCLQRQYIIPARASGSGFNDVNRGEWTDTVKPNSPQGFGERTSATGLTVKNTVKRAALT